MNFELTEKPSFDTRGNEVLVIFPNRPYWFAATIEIIDVISAFESSKDRKAIVKEIASKLDVSNEEAEETFETIVELLFDNCVLTMDGKASENAAENKPNFQVNVVENVLVIAATQACNLRCLHCYANARKKLPNEMSTDEIRVLVDQLASMPWKNDVSRVALTGGEYFSRTDAMQIVDYVHSKGFKVIISSNALLFTQGDIKKLATYPDLKVSVSLDGPTAEVHEMIRGEGTFTRTTEAIRALSKNGVFVGVNMFIHQGNVNLVEETLTLSHSIGVQAFNCLNMMQVGRANSCQSQQELQRIPEHVLYELLFEILRRNPHHRKMMRNSTFANQIMGIAAGVKSHYCGIGTNRAIYVRADGNVYPCPDTVLPEFCLGNIRQDDLEEIWEKSPLLEKLRRLNVDTMNASCAKCDVRYICGGGCRGENYQVTGKLESPHFNCNEWRRSILNMMWMLVDEPSFFEEKVKELYDKVGI